MHESSPELMAPLTDVYASKLGMVSVPTVLAPRDPEFDRLEAVALLQALGKDLGMTTQVYGQLTEDAVATDGIIFGDEAIRQTVGVMDVVWSKGPDMVAIFALETDGDRGVVARLADLLALGPKTKAAFYVVSVPALRAELLSEIHRPIYRLLKKNFAETVRLLDWPRLQSEVTELGERVRYLKAEFLEGISEFPTV